MWKKLKGKEYKLAIKIAAKVEKSFKDAMGNAKGAFEGLEKAGKIAFNTIKTGATIAATTAGTIVAASTAIGSAFESQMSTVQAISGATKEEFHLLKQKAQEMGETTSFSASEAGKAMEYMGMAGWKAQDMINGIDGIMDLAAASGEELGIVSDIVTDALTAFGLKAENSAEFADILAAASSNANTNVSMMGETFSYAAPVAGALGYSVKDTALVIGLMANSGIKASQAGTALRRILNETTKEITLSGKAFAKAGKSTGEFTVETVNADGSMRELKDIIDDLRTGFSGLSESEQSANAEAIVGKNAMSGLLAIINASENDYQKLYHAIENSAGAAKRMADIRLDNFSGDITLMKSALEGLGIEIFNGMNGTMREGVQLTTNFIGDITKNLKSTNAISKMMQTLSKNIPTTLRHLKEFKNSFVEFSKPLLNVGAWLIKNPNIVVSTLIGIGTTLATYKIASGILNVAHAFMALSPAGAIILTVGTAIAAISGITSYISRTNKDLKNQNLANHFGKISLSLKELQEVASYIVQVDSFSKLGESLEALQELEKITDSFENANKEINKLNWKISIGMDLSVTDQQSYLDNVETLITNAQEAVLQKQYATTLNLEIFTDDDEQGQKIRNQFTTFYQNNYNSISQLGSDLRDCVNTSFEDGLLTFDEAKKIQELQKQIADMTQKMTASQFEGELSLLEMKYSAGELDAESFQNLQVEINEKMQEATKQFEEGYVFAISNAKLMLDEEAIDKSEYNEMVAEIKQNYLQEISNLQISAADFQVNTVMNAYSEELAAALPELQKNTDGIISDAIRESIMKGQVTTRWDIAEIEKILNFESLESSTADALGELFKNLKPSMEVLEETRSKYVEWGMEVPESVSNGITNISTLGALTKDTDAIWTYISDVASSDEYRSSIKEVYDAGIFVPEQVIKAVNDKDKEIESSANTLYKNFCNHMKTNFGSQLNLKVPLNLTTSITMQSDLKNIKTGNFSKSDMIPLPGHADGGIFDKPHVALFAEAGPEAVIPLDFSKNAIDLWHQTGQLLGMENSFEEQKPERITTIYDRMNEHIEQRNVEQKKESIQITYSPQNNYYLEKADKEDIIKIEQEKQEDFGKMMANWIKENKRISY